MITCQLLLYVNLIYAIIKALELHTIFKLPKTINLQVIFFYIASSLYKENYQMVKYSKRQENKPFHSTMISIYLTTEDTGYKDRIFHLSNKRGLCAELPFHTCSQSLELYRLYHCPGPHCWLNAGQAHKVERLQLSRLQGCLPHSC